MRKATFLTFFNTSMNLVRDSVDLASRPGGEGHIRTQKKNTETNTVENEDDHAADDVQFHASVQLHASAKQVIYHLDDFAIGYRNQTQAYQQVIDSLVVAGHLHESNHSHELAVPAACAFEFSHSRQRLL